MEPFNAVFLEEGGWVVGWIEELPGAVAQERTLDAIIECFKVDPL